ncbi:hypothetical protein CTAYLR_002802 [Chrysophaeum taylorii]|uniref:Phosphatidate cytidylyltransferase n=1 Tax=Chrysophaeum taylorii TaxID=2483200 RepID=A0AAD7U7Z4_9STRA|nr:hypothetical protein CTAYLR_002802 [Chrysophaeum taylorii]
MILVSLAWCAHGLVGPTVWHHHRINLRQSATIESSSSDGSSSRLSRGEVASKLNRALEEQSPHKPLEPISRYAVYIRELWRANETRSAHDCCAPPRSTSLRSRATTGVGLGIVFTAWIFSSDAAFALGMAAQAIVAQLEYFRMAIASGAAPARRIVVCSSLAMLYAACYAPSLHELVFPLAGTWIMLWFLLMRPNCSSINDISTTLMGLFYTAYLPSWWVRLRCAPAWETAVPPFHVHPFLSYLVVDPAKLSTAVAVWWTCLGVAVSDIGAYFGGKRFGTRSLKSIGLGAAAKASPNKTLEGALSGFAASAAVATLGAAAMRWPYWPLAGPLYGLLVSMVALVGDLTASMLKRDGDVKDFGDLLPGHGGLLDRLDGFIFVPPLAYCLLPKLLPA